MPRIDDTPTAVTGAGTTHNYNNTPTSTVVLVNAPVDAGMTVAGVNRGAYDTYITAAITGNRAHVVNDVLLLDPQRPFILDLDFTDAASYNYARVTIGGRSWYMFIDRVEYKNPNAVMFHTTIDPFATYGWTLGHSHITRGHAAVAASQSDTYGVNYCTAPEPITAPPAVGTQSSAVLSSTLDDWTVIVISANDLRGSGVTPYFERHVAEDAIKDAASLARQAARQPVYGPEDYMPTGDRSAVGGEVDFSISKFESEYPWHDPDETAHYVPTVRPSRISRIDGVPQGGGAFLFTPAGYVAWLSVVQAATWVVEGITDIRMVPTWCVSGGGDGTPGTLDPPRTGGDARWNAAAAIPVFQANITTGSYDSTVLNGWRDTYLNGQGAAIYRKLVTSQFTKIALGNGDTMEEYDPELMQTPGVNVHARTGLAHGEHTIRLTADYNQLGNQKGVNLEAGGAPGTVTSGFGRAASNTGSADLGLANAAATSYLSRQAMEYNAMLARHLEVEQVPMNMGIIGVQSVMQAAAAGVAGGAMLGPGGAIAGAVLGGGSALVTSGLSANSSLDMMDISQLGSIDVGSYQLGRNGVFNTQAFRTWVQALRASPGRGGSAALSSAWRAVTGQAFHVIITTPAADHVRQLLSTWRRYGYMIGRVFTPPRMDAMTRFTYWKTEDAVVLGGMPNDDRERVAGAFNTGVTLYTSLSDIGVDVSGSNNPIPGFTY